MESGDSQNPPDALDSGSRRLRDPRAFLASNPRSAAISGKIRATLPVASATAAAGAICRLMMMRWTALKMSFQSPPAKPVDIVWTSPLSAAEFDLLPALCRRPGKVIARADLLAVTHVGSAKLVERSADVHVSRLRRKFFTQRRQSRLHQDRPAWRLRVHSEGRKWRWNRTSAAVDKV
jgi:hypothetical protein